MDLGRDTVYQELCRCAGTSNSWLLRPGWKSLTVGYYSQTCAYGFRSRGAYFMHCSRIIAFAIPPSTGRMAGLKFFYESTVDHILEHFKRARSSKQNDHFTVFADRSLIMPSRNSIGFQPRYKKTHFPVSPPAAMRCRRLRHWRDRSQPMLASRRCADPHRTLRSFLCTAPRR